MKGRRDKGKKLSKSRALFNHGLKQADCLWELSCATVQLQPMQADLFTLGEGAELDSVSEGSREGTGVELSLFDPCIG